MSDSVWPQRQQPTMLHCPWGSPDKNTGVACHFLLQCMKVKSESEVAQVVYLKVTESCLTPSNPMDCSLPGSSVHGIFQARVLEWGAIAFPRILTRETKNENFGKLLSCSVFWSCFWLHNFVDLSDFSKSLQQKNTFSFACKFKML